MSSPIQFEKEKVLSYYRKIGWNARYHGEYDISCAIDNFMDDINTAYDYCARLQSGGDVDVYDMSDREFMLFLNITERHSL